MRHHFILAEFFDAYDELTPTKIDKHLSLIRTKITSLGELRHVGGRLNISNSKITSLGNLQYVGRVLAVDETEINSVGKLNFVGDYIFCSAPEQFKKLLPVCYRLRFVLIHNR